MPYRVLDHTADTGIEANAESPETLIRELAKGMFGILSPVDPCNVDRWVEVKVEASSLEDLVVDTLSELLYESEVEDLLFCDFHVTMAKGGRALTLAAGGVPVHSVEPSGPPIKAVTYHGLVVEQRETGWYGRVYFDV